MAWRPRLAPLEAPAPPPPARSLWHSCPPLELYLARCPTPRPRCPPILPSSLEPPSSSVLRPPGVRRWASTPLNKTICRSIWVICSEFISCVTIQGLELQVKLYGVHTIAMLPCCSFPWLHLLDYDMETVPRYLRYVNPRHMLLDCHAYRHLVD